MIVQYLDCARYCRRVMLCSIRLYFFSIFLAYYAANCYETYQKQNMCMFSNSFHFSTNGVGVYIYLRHIETQDTSVCIYRLCAFISRIHSYI
jgi:hypothetical protein